MDFLPTTKAKHFLRRAASAVAAKIGDPSSGGKAPICDFADVEKAFGLHMFHDLLSVSHYDPNGYFVSKKSVGFTLELSTICGSSDALLGDLTSLFRNFPEGSNLQCMLLADHRIGDFLDSWENAGTTDNEFIMSLNRATVEGMKDLALSGELAIRKFRVILSFSIPMGSDKGSSMEKAFAGRQAEGEGAKKIKKLLEHKRKIIRVFDYKGFQVREMGSSELLTFLHDFLYPTSDLTSSNMKASCLDTIADQMTNPGGLFKVHKDGLDYSYRKKTWTIQSLSPKKMPDKWHQMQMFDLIGGKGNHEQLDWPFAIHIGMRIEDRGLGEKWLNFKASQVAKQARSELKKYLPNIEREAAEWAYAGNCQQLGDKFVRTGYTVLAFSPKERAEDLKEQLESLYRDQGWELRTDDYIHLLSLLSTLPMQWSEDGFDTMKKMKRTKLSLTGEPGHFLPLQGEHRGGPLRGILMVTRKGQILNFSNYFSKTNYNIVIIGVSGAGKSFVMILIMLTVLSRSGRVFVLDTGRSFKHVAVAMREGVGHDAEHITFKGAGICINPFSNVYANAAEYESGGGCLEDEGYVDYMDDEIEMLTAIIAEMAAPINGLDDLQMPFLGKAIRSTWNKYGQESNISKVAEMLFAGKSPVEHDLAQMLYFYTKDGPHGRYFEGKANITFSKALSVIEFEELKKRPNLQKVVLKILMIQISNQMIGEKRELFQIVMDEAWDLLKGRETGAFMEALARKIRKYKGSLLIGTQALVDLFTGTGPRAVFDNSAFIGIMKQKAGAISALKKRVEFPMTDAEELMYRGLDTVPGKYSEICLQDDDDNSFIARIYPSKFILLLLSSSADDVNAVQAKVRQGMETVDAVYAVLKDRENV